ncbi:SPR1 [Citrus sinensis]|uniref:Protein SPIRAL1-like 3 n=1 Tax=Citrus sinensis TaxID=2711 RepID=A0A067CZM1_CITSI|nr:protein SPIRAL1-like 3 [Citrus sinensis]KAH9676800.1 SPR1 [Citrus sinensis]KDO35963.1 hypothetical protein CISIN_1g036270mg [Citrus sinensis]
MGRRGVSAGGGQSSLGYLFGGGSGDTETSTSTSISAQQSQKLQASAPNIVSSSPSPSDYHHQKPASTATVDKLQIPAGIPGNRTNNYYRADGQNCGNFITNRPSTKVHAAPGGGSSLGYLFGGSGN